jgi:glycosyltransferase involved in cell wall biosynthesis
MAAPGALTLKIQEAIGHEESLRRYSELGKARVENCYAWRVLAPRYIEMYRSIATT